MSTAVLAPPADARPADGGAPARRAVVRWAWRLFRREWRQQFLILALITVAVAATIVGSAVATNTPPPKNFGFGTAQGTPRPLRATTRARDERHRDLEHRFGRVEVIENETMSIPGSINTFQLRAQDPHGPFSGPMLSLVSGHYPAGAGEVAVTSGVASAFHLKLGDTWRVGGVERRVVGIVENPQSLLDEFALVAPGQVTNPTGVTVLVRRPGCAARARSKRRHRCRRRPRSPSRTRSTPRPSRSRPSCSACCSSRSSRSAASPCSRSAASARSACSSRPAPPTATSVSSSARTARSSVSSVPSSASCSGSSSGSPIGRASSRARTTSSGCSPCRGSWSPQRWCSRSSRRTSPRPDRRGRSPGCRSSQALSGRPAPPRQIHRSAIPGIVFLVRGVPPPRLLRAARTMGTGVAAPGARARDRAADPRADPARAVLPVADRAARPACADRDPTGASRSRPLPGALGLGAGGDQRRRPRRSDRHARRRGPLWQRPRLRGPEPCLQRARPPRQPAAPAGTTVVGRNGGVTSSNKVRPAATTATLSQQLAAHADADREGARRAAHRARDARCGSRTRPKAAGAGTDRSTSRPRSCSGRSGSRRREIDPERGRLELASGPLRCLRA